MRVVLSPHGRDDYSYWQTSDSSTLKRIDRLIDDDRRDSSPASASREQLRHALARTWSRRTPEEHRLVHLVDCDDLVSMQTRLNYE